jgi:hypothetical protein
MLKLTYMETGFHLEHLAQSLEDWVSARVMLALRVGNGVCVQPSTASFLLPADLPELAQLQIEARREGSEIIQMSVCDADYVEVCLYGTWLSAGSGCGEGVFVTAMSDRTEFFLFKLWQDSQVCTSSLR